MFDNFVFDDSYFDKIVITTESTQQDIIAYNGYGLSNQYFIINKIDFDNGNSISSDTYANPLTDMGGELNYFFREKIVNISGFIKSDTSENLTNKIDELKSILGQNNKNLDIKVLGVIRRAKASCININSLFNREHYNITILPFTLEFRVINDFFKELQSQSQSFTGFTAGFTEEILNKGSVRTSPIINILINSATTTNQITFNIGENTIIINKTINNSDVIVINCIEKSIKINNIEVDYSGVFPILEIGLNTYTIGINGTVNYNITLSYFNNYL